MIYTVVEVFFKEHSIHKWQDVLFPFTMPSPSNTYNKQNSILDIRHHKTLEDIAPQIRKLKERLHTLPLPDYKKSIVNPACSELLDPDSIDKKLTPLQGLVKL